MNNPAASCGMGLRSCVAGHTVSVLDTAQASSPLLHRFAQAGLRALIATPLLVEGSICGLLLAVRREPQAFSDGEGEFLRQLSQHVALAAHQASLHAKLQQAYNDLYQSQQVVMQQERLRALGQRVSGIAHDITNTISPITLYVESLLASEATLSTRAREYLSVVQQAANDVARTVARLREFYHQPNSPQAALPLDLNFFVSQALMRPMRAQWPAFSVNDLKAWFRGRKYVVETLKLLPAMPDALFIDQVVSQMAELGRVNHAVNPA